MAGMNVLLEMLNEQVGTLVSSGARASRFSFLAN